MTWKTWRLRSYLNGDWVDCPMGDADTWSRWNAVPINDARITMLASGWTAAVIPHLAVVDQLWYADRMEAIE